MSASNFLLHLHISLHHCIVSAPYVHEKEAPKGNPAKIPEL